MKITIEHYDTKVSGEIPDDSDIFDVAGIIFALLVASGFHVETVRCILKEKK